MPSAYEFDLDDSPNECYLRDTGTWPHGDDSKPSIIIDGSQHIDLAIPGLDNGEEALHFFSAITNVSGPEQSLIQEVVLQYYCPTFNSGYFTGTNSEIQLQYILGSGPETIDYEKDILNNCRNEGWQAMEFYFASRLEPDSLSSVPLTVPELAVLGIIVDVSTSSLTIDIDNTALAGILIVINIREYITEDPFPEVSSTVRI